VSDAELIARLKANDDDAYREVVARYGDALYSYTYLMTGDHRLTEDIVNESYLRLAEQVESASLQGGPLQTWLYRVAHDQTIRTLRRRSSASPPVMLSARLSAEALRSALFELPEDQQQIVLMRFVGRQSPAQIAGSLGLAETDVMQLQCRALRSLSRSLEHRKPGGSSNVYDWALDACLELLQAGHSVDACLLGFPAEASAIEAPLRIAEQLMRLPIVAMYAGTRVGIEDRMVRCAAERRAQAAARRNGVHLNGRAPADGSRTLSGPSASSRPLLLTDDSPSIAVPRPTIRTSIAAALRRLKRTT
jgi:RNA polymerase sigma-70 factor (ECF subfamily)